jgi:integrase/recombinase XerD
MTQRLESHSPDDLKLAQPIPLTRHPAEVYLSGLGSGSRRTIRYSLNTMANLLTGGECDALTIDWSKLRYHHTAALRVAVIQAQDYQKAVDFPNIGANSQPRGRSLSSSEISALMKTCDWDNPLDIRDAAIIAILRFAGLRRAELVSLELSDLNVTKGELLVRKGKRGKSRKVYLPNLAVAFVEKWLFIRGSEPGALFCRIRKGGHLHLGSLHPDAIWRLFQKRALMAGLESFSPHDFRRTFCSDLLDAGVDLVTVQKLAGHASPVTTASYDRRGEETLRSAIQRLSIQSNLE